MYILFADRSQSAFLCGTLETLGYSVSAFLCKLQNKKEKFYGGTTIGKEKKRFPPEDA